MNTIYSTSMQIYLCIFLVAEDVVADIITILVPMMLIFLQDKQAIYKFRHPGDTLQEKEVMGILKVLVSTEGWTQCLWADDNFLTETKGKERRKNSCVQNEDKGKGSPVVFKAKK